MSITTPASIDFYRRLAQHAGVAFVTLEPTQGAEDTYHAVEPVAAGLLSADVCRQFGILPIALREGTVTIASSEPVQYMAYDVAAALKLSKGGLYHHFQSKDEILFNLMDHAMDITQQRVIDPVRGIADPEQRLRMLIRLHIEVVLSDRDREITVMLHENHPLPPALRRRINSRKKDYVHFMENLIADVQRGRQSKGIVSPRAAVFALLGMINWIYQWHKPEGTLQAEQLAAQYTAIFFSGAFQ